MDYRETTTDTLYTRYAPIQYFNVPHDLMIGDHKFTITFPSGATLTFDDIKTSECNITMAANAYDTLVTTSIEIPFRRASICVTTPPESMSWSDVYDVYGK